MKTVVAIVVTALLLGALMSGGAFAARKIVVIDATGNIQGTRRAADEFTKKTGIEVEAIATTWAEYETRVRSMIAGGLPFDVIRVDQARAYQSKALGFTSPLDSYMAQDKFDTSDFPNPVIDYWAFKSTGQHYFIPYEVSTTVIWYSAAEFQEAGLERLPTQWGHPSLQWNNFVSTARKLTRDLNGDGNIDRWGLEYPNQWGWMYVGIWGQQWVDPYANRFLGATPKLVDAITSWMDLSLTFGVTPRWGQHSGTQSSMRIGQTPQTAFAADPRTYELAVAPMPWGTQSAMQGGINGWALSKTAKDPDAAWQFIKYFTADEGINYWAEYRSGNSPVVNRKYYRQWIDRFQERLSLTSQDVVAILEGSNYFWDVPLLVSPAYTKMQVPFNEALRSIAAGEKSATQAMTEIEPTMNSLLKEQPFTL